MTNEQFKKYFTQYKTKDKSATSDADTFLLNFKKRVSESFFKMKMKNHLYTGDLASIFDGDCEFTNEILKQRKEEIREYLDDDHGISGTKILIFWRDIQYLKGMKTIEKEMEMNKEEVKLSGSTLLMLFEIKKIEQFEEYWTVREDLENFEYDYKQGKKVSFYLSRKDEEKYHQAEQAEQKEDVINNHIRKKRIELERLTNLKNKFFHHGE